MKNLLKKSTALLTLCFSGMMLSACNSTTTPKLKVDPQVQLKAPKTITHQNKRYHLKNQKDLGEIARYVYFEKKENGKNWKSAVELLQDRNGEHRTLTERIALREKVYQNNGVKHFNLTDKDGVLYAFVIYAPNKQQDNWQVEVARGADVEGCGFVQYQYSVKVPHSRKLANMGKVKLVSYLKKFAIDPEMARLAKLKWDWRCELPNTSVGFSSKS